MVMYPCRYNRCKGNCWQEVLAASLRREAKARAIIAADRTACIVEIDGDEYLSATIEDESERIADEMLDDIRGK